jgi:hypothetical protein
MLLRSRQPRRQERQDINGWLQNSLQHFQISGLAKLSDARFQLRGAHGQRRLYKLVDCVNNKTEKEKYKADPDSHL